MGLAKRILRFGAAAVCALGALALLVPALTGSRKMELLAALPLLLLAAGLPLRLGRKREGAGLLRHALRAAYLLCAAWAAATAALFLVMAAAARAPLREDVAAILIPGCLVDENGMSPMLLRRCDKAAELAQQFPDAVLIASGAEGEGESEPECEAIARYLIAQGIDPARILMERDARYTAENLSGAAALLEEAGIEGCVAIVSDDFHLLRALLFARRLGMDACPCACSRSTLRGLRYWVREELAFGHALLFGY